MTQAMQDAQAIRSGQITRDQLPSDRQANLDAASALAKGIPPDALQTKLNAYQAVKNDAQELAARIDESNKSCFMSVCASNFTLAKGWGTVAAAVQTTDVAADTVRATGVGGPVVSALAKEWKAARDIGESAFAGGEAGGKAFGFGQARELVAEGTPGRAGGDGFSAHPPGASGNESGGEKSDAGERVADGLKFSGKAPDALLNANRLGDEIARNPLEVGAERALTKGDRGIALVNGAADAAEAYNNWNKGERYDAAVSGTKSLSNLVKAAGNRDLAEAIENTGGALESTKKTIQNGWSAEGVAQGLQAAGSLGKILNKDAGAAVQDTGKLLSTITAIQSVRETEMQVLQTRARMIDNIDQRINNVQQLQQLQMMLNGDVQGETIVLP
jgi:hypothetical protein